MKYILHLDTPEDGLLACRAAEAVWQDQKKPGSTSIIEYENGHRFQVTRNKTSIGVWRLP